MATDFSVKTQAAAFQDGYQRALGDIAAAFESGGYHAALEWIANNHTQKGA
jgi:hypothetical protein